MLYFVRESCGIVIENLFDDPDGCQVVRASVAGVIVPPDTFFTCAGSAGCCRPRSLMVQNLFGRTITPRFRYPWSRGEKNKDRTQGFKRLLGAVMRIEKKQTKIVHN